MDFDGAEDDAGDSVCGTDEDSESDEGDDADEDPASECVKVTCGEELSRLDYARRVR